MAWRKDATEYKAPAHTSREVPSRSIGSVSFGSTHDDATLHTTTHTHNRVDSESAAIGWYPCLYYLALRSPPRFLFSGTDIKLSKWSSLWLHQSLLLPRPLRLLISLVCKPSTVLGWFMLSSAVSALVGPALLCTSWCCCTLSPWQSSLEWNCWIDFPDVGDFIKCSFSPYFDYLNSWLHLIAIFRFASIFIIHYTNSIGKKVSNLKNCLLSQLRRQSCFRGYAHVVYVCCWTCSTVFSSEVLHAPFFTLFFLLFKFQAEQTSDGTAINAAGINCSDNSQLSGPFPQCKGGSLQACLAILAVDAPDATPVVLHPGAKRTKEYNELRVVIYVDKNDIVTDTPNRG